MMEQWRPTHVPGYEVSNMGRVRGVERPRPDGGRVRARIMRLRADPARGYLHVELYAHGKRESCLVHRLVMAAFRPCPIPGMQVNHINGDKHDNRLTNLEWVTATENIRHARDVLGVMHGNPGERNGKAKLTEAQVREIRRRYVPRKNGGLAGLAREYGVDPSTIWAAVYTHWRHVGGANG